MFKGKYTAGATQGCHFSPYRLILFLQSIEKKSVYPSTHKVYTERSSKTTLDPLLSLSIHKQFQMSLSSFLQERKEKKNTENDMEEESGKDRKKEWGVENGKNKTLSSSLDSCTLDFNPDGCPIRGHKRVFCGLKKETGQGLEAGSKEPFSPFSTI